MYLYFIFADVWHLSLIHFDSHSLHSIRSWWLEFLISQRVFFLISLGWKCFFSFFLSFCTEWIWRGVAKVTTGIKNHPRRRDADRLWSCKLTGRRHCDSQPRRNWKLRRDPIGTGRSTRPTPSARNRTTVIGRDWIWIHAAVDCLERCCEFLVPSYWNGAVICNFTNVNFVKNEILKVWILWKMWFWKCEFCENWDFESVNFVKNEI